MEASDDYCVKNATAFDNVDRKRPHHQTLIVVTPNIYMPRWEATSQQQWIHAGCTLGHLRDLNNQQPYTSLCSGSKILSCRINDNQLKLIIVGVVG